MNSVEIREMTSDQNCLYKQFLSSGFIEDEESFRITKNDDLNAPFPTKDTQDNFTLGAYVENTLAGVVSFTRDGIDREKLRHKGILFRMYVAKEFRGQGISKRLIEKLLIRVRELRDIEQINLTVISNNITAKALYTKFGFENYGLEKNAIKWHGKYFNEDQMVLILK